MGKISFNRQIFKIPRITRPRISLKWLLLIVLILIIGGGGIWAYQNFSALPPEAAVLSAIEKTLNAESYRYHAISKKIVDNQEQLLSEVMGEKSNGNVHFIGKLHVVNSDFEIYQVNNKFYRKDVFSKDWLVLDQVNMEATEKLIQEINPLGTFSLCEPLEVQYVGKEKINGQKCRKYEVLAQNENKYLEVLWKDFSYVFWVNKDGLLTKAEINAVNKQHENHSLIMSVEFSDYNEKIEINAPI